jgi:plastocyanin
MRKLLLLPLLVFALAAAAPVGAADTHQSSITKTGFAPANPTIKNGDVMTWTNNDTAVHQIVADDGSFSSDMLSPGQSYTHVFVDWGTFGYHDGTNPNAKGTITVDRSRFTRLGLARTVTVKYTRATLIKGSVSAPDATGEQVLVQAKPYGETDFTTVARPSTSHGYWRALVRPRVNTVYRAVWSNVPSGERTIWVKPLLTLTAATHHRWLVRATAGMDLRGHHVLLQRRTRHGWVAYRSLKLKALRQSQTSYFAIARFTLRAKRGTVLRARMTRGQARPGMYGPSISNSVRVR